MLEIQLRLIAHQNLPRRRHISACQTPFLSIGIIKPEHFTKLLIVCRITEAHHGVAVHQDTIALVGNDERH